MEYVTLVNRSSKVLKGTWDGRHYELAPGKHSFPRVQAEKFRDQNPIMGTEDPRTLFKQYLIGIVENGDDCSPIEQSEAITLQPLDTENKKVVRGNGLYSQVDRTAGLPVENAFVKP